MPRYFFKVFDRDDVFDDVGAEFVDLRAARRHMLEVAVRAKDKFEEIVLRHGGWKPLIRMA